MTVSRHRFGFTHNNLNKALYEYHRLREELEEDDPDDNAFIVISDTPRVLRNLARAASAHARSMQDWTDDIYWRDLSGEDD